MSLRDIEGLPALTNMGYTSIRVLEFLYGLKWDEFAMNYVYAHRPSRVRVSTGMVESDSVLWRVTVLLGRDKETIESIEQEVEVGLLGGLLHGHALRTELMRRLKKRGEEKNAVDVP